MDITIVGKYLSTLPEDDDHPYRTGLEPDAETDHHEQLCRYCSDKRGQQAALTGLQEVATQPVEQRPL